MKKEYSAKIQPLFANEEFEAKFKAISDPAKLPDLFKEYGVTLSDEEMADFISSACEGKADEIDPAELDKVSGGFAVTLAAAALGATWNYACAVYGGPEQASVEIYKYWRNKFR